MTGTVVAAESTPSAPAPDASAARPPRRRRRVIAWIVIAAIVIGGVLVAVAAGGRPDRVPWGPDDPSPEGSKALVQVLRDQGVRVTATTSLAETRNAIRNRDETTVVLADEEGYLSGARLRRLDGIAAHLVLLQPGYEELGALAPEVTIRGPGRGTADGCRIGGVRPSDRVTATGIRYVPNAGSDAETCLGDLDTGYGLVRLGGRDGMDRVDVVGAGAALRNGNALVRADGAFGLAVVGETRDVVWYVPSSADLPTSGLPEDLLPGWWPPVAVLLVLVFVAAVVWRARRFGPLAVENLPVIVPASETMEGRARLYARSSTRTHALDALRIGAIGRLASICGLPRSASVDEVVDRVAAATGRPRAELAALLRDREVDDDRSLVELSRALAALERETREATHGR